MKFPWTKAADRTKGEIEKVQGAILDVAREVQAIPSADDLRPDLGPIEDQLAQHQDLLDGFEVRVKDLMIAISEGIERTSRAENRVKATITRARKELANSGLVDPSLEAEVAELRLVDGDGSQNDGMQHVPENLEEPRATDDAEQKNRELMANLRLRGIG